MEKIAQNKRNYIIYIIINIPALIKELPLIFKKKKG
jgi:hypothetical protein